MGILETVSAFKARVKPFRDVWKSIDARMILCKHGGDWYNVLTSLRFSPEKPRNQKVLEGVELSNFLVGRASVRFELIDSVLDEIPKSIVTLASRKVRLGDPKVPTPPEGSYRWDSRIVEREYVGRLLGNVPPFRTIALEGWGPSLQQFWTHTEWDMMEPRLLAQDPHYRGIPDAARSLMGAPYSIGLGASSGMTILAPLYACFEPEMELKGGALTVRASGPSTASPKDFRLATTLWTGATDRRRTDRFSDGDASATEDRLLLRKKIEVPDAQSIDLLLLFRNEPVDTQTYVLPSRLMENARLRTHAHFDLNFDRLNQYLTPKREDTRSIDGFEVGVAWLFHLCGFEVVNYGIKGFRLGNEIDILAFAPFSKSILAIEATAWDPLNADKLTKLRRRADELSQILAGYEIHTTVVAGSDLKYEAEESEAKNLGITILRPANIRRLFEMAQENVSAHDVLEYVRFPR